MKTNYEIRYAAHPEDAKGYDTQRIRRDFLMEKVFSDNEVNMVYSMYDRMIVGGARPVGEVLKLEAIDPLKAPYFLTRREMGIFNVGGPGVVKAGDAVFELDYKEALYLGSVSREYLALPDGPGRFTQNSSCSALLRILLCFDNIRIRNCHALWSFFPESSSLMSSCNGVVLQPHPCRNMDGLGCSPFARHYWGNHCLFSFPAGTKMFQFPALASNNVG